VTNILLLKDNFGNIVQNKIVFYHIVVVVDYICVSISFKK